MKRLIAAGSAAFVNDGTPIGIIAGWLVWSVAWALNSKSVETLLYGGTVLGLVWYSLMVLALYVEERSGTSRSARARSLKQFIASLPHREHFLLAATAVLWGVALFNWDTIWIALALGASMAMAVRLRYYALQPVD